MKVSADHGRPIGEDHHRTSITDAELDAMRRAYEESHLTMNQIANACFREGCTNRARCGHTRSFWTVRAILRYNRRNTQPRIE